MAVPSSGELQFTDFQTEFGGSNPIAMSEYYGLSTLPASNEISAADFYGTTAIEAEGTAWTTTTSISTSRDRRLTRGVGGEGDHVLMGGYTGAARVGLTDEWNGSAWGTASTMPGSGTTAGHASGGSGGLTSNDAGSFGGYRYENVTYEYNGSAWSTTGNMATGRQSVSGCGESTTAMLSAGGDNGSKLTTTEEYNGASWASGGALSVGTSALGVNGSQTAALGMMGSNGTINLQTTSEYNGTSWSAGGSVSMAAGQDPNAWGNDMNSAHVSGSSGDKAAHELYNGTAFTTKTSHNTGRTSAGSGGGAGSGFVASGSGTSAITPTCEKWV